MTVKTIVHWARAIAGYSGVAVYTGGIELFSENVDAGHAAVLLELIHASSGARRLSAAARGFTFIAFRAGACVVVLKMAGRFPLLPVLSLAEPEFVDLSCAPAMPSRDDARREAEAALRQFGLM